MSLPSDQDSEWQNIADQWRDICVKEGIQKGTPDYNNRANKFFDDLYMASKQFLGGDKS